MKGSAAQRKEVDTGDCWNGFRAGDWTTSINVRDFIVRNVTPYTGSEDFLVAPSQRTKAVWAKLQPYFADERKKGVLAVDAAAPSTLLAHKPGYIDRENEVIVGLQTDQPFKRAIFPYGGLRMVEAGLKAAGFDPDPAVHEAFTKYRKSHNDGVFDAYTPEIMNCRRSGIITGLPDAYGRGRIIGDYRRVALYGVDRLLEVKREERAQIDDMWPTDEIIRLREELSEQMRALKDLASMAKLYDRDIAKPASNAQEAFQWTYFAYLGAIKEANGAAMSIGRVSTFLDIFIERDLKDGVLDEARAQELWDQLVQKLRIVRFLRTPDYDALFSGDPYWATECVGGMDLDGRALVTKSSYRMLHTLHNLGPAPEPNITILWSNHMPAPFKRYCVKVSRDTSSLQYENDDLMRPFWGDDYGIACCVSAMRLGKQMQFFGARVNLAKALLYAINGGRDEVSGEQVSPADIACHRRIPRLRRSHGQVRQHHGMAGPHLRACDELHPLHARQVFLRTPGDGAPRSRHSENDGVRDRRAFGCCRQPECHEIRKIRVMRDQTGLVVDYQNVDNTATPQFGNNDDRVDQIASSIVTSFMEKIRKHPTYRNATHTQSVLTITSNVVYGKATGNTPDGRRKGEPFGPGANPMHGRDSHGWLASCLSVAKLPYKDAQDGISYTVSIAPQKAH